MLDYIYSIYMEYFIYIFEKNHNGMLFRHDRLGNPTICNNMNGC